MLGYLGKQMRGDGGTEIATSLEREREVVQQNDGMFGKVLDMLDGDDGEDSGSGGLLDMAGDLLSGSAGRAILGKLLAR